MLNKPLPTSVKDLYRLRSEMAVELLNASGTMHKLYVHAAMHIHITILCVLCIFILMV